MGSAYRAMILSACLALAGAASLYAADDDQKPNGKGHHPKGAPPVAAGAQVKGAPNTNGINYHGGPVILGTTNVYYIWYGNWSDNTAMTILPDLASNLGGSPYFNINTTYYNGANVH